MTLHDKIKGALYGFALGDALGKGTEFMSRAEVQAYYPDGLRDFKDIIHDGHRTQWKPNEWTNDTIFMATVAEQFMRDGDFDAYAQARELLKTINSHAKDLIPLYRIFVQTPEWAENPFGVTHRIWKERGITDEPNDANHRCVAVGILSHPDKLEHTIRHAVLMTNDDSRCVASVTALAMMANTLLHTGEPADIDTLSSIGYSIDARIIPYLDSAYNGTLPDLKLDDGDTMTSCRKCMAAALWTIWHCDNAADSIYKMVDQGGDSDSNAAIAGAMAGLRFGYDAIPDLKNELMGRDYLDGLADRMTRYVESQNG